MIIVEPAGQYPTIIEYTALFNVYSFARCKSSELFTD